MRLRLLPLMLLLSACSGSLKGVQTFSYSGGEVRGGLIAYDRLPPAGGPYGPLWQTCGVYGAPVYPEYAVHSLARGAVWLTYRPDLSSQDVAALTTGLGAEQDVLLSPLEGQGAAVIASAWNAQLSVDDAADSRLRRFVQKYRQASTVPEAGQPCSGGYAGTQ
ncbi:hypothetical protein DKM44_02950 [Deinococcus irradiatisoli]|uniref:DUF3105 domain-containing protein n=1 Tax=Deinococcus irradiatisoli TaxID=2202254 RepID=A0A2Z3JB15_9DEIO|nr:DUF3105 domain-containing protein [Deinococcus irradiatisoli]AWN22323.1 hypothetical protein DKM44_02950 [Deinococcus irradiatisoli]